MKNEDKFNELLGAPLENIVSSATMETLERNADLAHNAGFKSIIIRTANSNDCCDWCAGLAGVYNYPCDKEVYQRHDNCECTVEYVTDKYKQNVWTKKKTAIEKSEIDEQIKAVEKRVSENNDLLKHVRALEKRGVEYNQVTKQSKPMSEKEIIRLISGGDETKGSCASLTIAYIGQKNGFDILDFRGGESLNYFAKSGNLKSIYKSLGAKISTIEAKTEQKAAIQALEDMKAGKQYCLWVGQHASIVRVNNGIFEYLELQDVEGNGWRPFRKSTLGKRFGCNKTQITLAGQKIMSRAEIFDIDTVKGDNKLQMITGFINTEKKKQRKGATGHVK